MKKTILFFTLAVLSLACVFASGKKEEETPVREYVQEKSFHGSISAAKDNAWVSREIITIRNNSDTEQKFLLSASFDRDFRAGNVNEKELLGFSDESGFMRIFTLAAGSTETFTVYFRGTFDGELRKLNRNALSADAVKILPASKSDLVREYFSFYKYLLYGEPVLSENFHYINDDGNFDIDAYNAYQDAFCKKTLNKAEVFLTDKALGEFSEWLRKRFAFSMMAQMIEEDLYSKICIKDMELSENSQNVTAQVLTSYNQADKTVRELAEKHTPNLEDQIDSDWEFISEGIGGKGYPTFTVSEKYSFYFADGKISRIEREILDAYYDGI